MYGLLILLSLSFMNLNDTYPESSDLDSVNEIQTHYFNNRTKGGLGGKVIKVTNLNSSGEGSFGAALEAEGARVIVFEVGGIIDLEMVNLKIVNPFVTISGQTAPYPGITIIKGGIYVLTHDVIVKHIMVRPGDAGQARQSGWEPDGISIYGEEAHHILIDHCSVTWSVDENLSVSGLRLLGPEHTAHHVTLSNNIIAEALHHSSHSKGKHSKGTLIHDNCQNIAIVGNLYAHNADRNPYFKGSTTGVIVNNLIYNPGSAAIRAGYVPGQWEGTDSPKPPLLSVSGNVLHLGKDSRKDMSLIKNIAEAFMDDNLAFDENGNQSKLADKEIILLKKKAIWVNGLEGIPASDVENSILKNVGARPRERDSIDQRIIRDFINKKGKILNSQEEVGGYPTRKSTSRKLEVPSGKIQEWLDEMEKEVL